jgi:hypothetical protein
MSRFLAILALLLQGLPFPGPGMPAASGGTPTLALVQHPTNGACPASSSTCSVTVASTGSGHLIVVGMGYGNGTQVTLSSVSGGGTYTVCTGCPGFDAAGLGTVMGYTLSSTSGATTITLNLSAAVGGSEAWAREYSCTNGALSYDTAGTHDNSTATTSATGATLTLTGTNDAIVQSVASGGSGVTAISAPYTTLDTPGGDGVANLLNTTSGAAPTWTQGNGVAAASGIAIKCQ